MGWQTTTNSVMQRAAYLYQSAEFSDVLFLVGQNEHMRVFPAHRTFLAMSSEVFAKMLNNKQWTKLIPDLHPDIFDAVLRYIYTDECEFYSPHHAIQVLQAAQMYQIAGLSSKCLAYITLCRTNAF